MLRQMVDPRPATAWRCAQQRNYPQGIALLAAMGI